MEGRTKDVELGPSSMTSVALTGAIDLRQNLPARDARVVRVARQTFADPCTSLGEAQ